MMCQLLGLRGLAHRHLPCPVLSLRFRPLLTVLLLIGVIAAPRICARPARVAPQVLAFYYTWYGAPDRTGAWRHWNEGGHHPDRRTPAGLPDIGATDHPPVPYDSTDPEVIRRHLAEAREAGIDGLIATWWGQGDWHDNAFKILLREAEAAIPGERAVRPIRVTVYYEQTPPGAGDPVAATAADLLYILNSYGDSPAFYRFDGKPAIFIYGRAVAELKPEQWREVLRRVKAERPVFIVGDGTDPDLFSVFDSLHEYNLVGDVVGGAAMGPRYARLVAAARERDRPAIVTVIPGYDDSHIGRPRPIIAPRDGGRLYTRLWNAALDANPDWVLVTTFNEWHEGSEVEPSREHGDLYLGLTSRFARIVHTGRPIVNADGPDGPQLPGGWRVEPLEGSRCAARSLPGGGVEVQNLSGGSGRLGVSLPRGEEPYVFEEGREGRLWRPLSPGPVVEGPSRGDADHGSPTPGADAFHYALIPNGIVQIWSGAAFTAAHPESPFAPMAAIGVHVDVASRWPAGEPDRWLVYPDGAFPLTVTLRNAGRHVLTDGAAELWAPEGWGHSRARLFDRLGPGQAASAMLAVRPSPQAPLGKPAPAFAWVRLRAGAPGSGAGGADRAGEPITLYSSVDLEPVQPLAAHFAFGARGAFTLHLQSRFPGRFLSGRVTLRPAEGRTAIEDEAPFALTGSADVTFHQRVPAGEPPALRRTYATLTVGGYRQLVSAVDTATVALGQPGGEHGVERIDWEDGRAEAMKGERAPGPGEAAERPAEAAGIRGEAAGHPAEPAGIRAVPNLPGRPHYLYFNVTEGLPRAGDTYVEVEYLDSGTGALALQYDSTDAGAPLGGRYKEAGSIPLANTGEWKRHLWRLPDARFAGRQNGGADFRLAMGPEPLRVRSVTVSKWPPSR